MDNKKNDTYYIKKVITDLEFLIKHTKDLTREQFGKD